MCLVALLTLAVMVGSRFGPATTLPRAEAATSPLAFVVGSGFTQVFSVPADQYVTGINAGVGPGTPNVVAQTADHNTLFIANGTALVEVDATTNSVVKTISAGGGVVGVAVSADGATLYVTHGQNTYSIVDVASSRVTSVVLPAPAAAYGIAVSGSNLYMVLVGHFDPNASQSNAALALVPAGSGTPSCSTALHNSPAVDFARQAKVVMAPGNAFVLVSNVYGGSVLQAFHAACSSVTTGFGYPGCTLASPTCVGLGDPSLLLSQMFATGGKSFTVRGSTVYAVDDYHVYRISLSFFETAVFPSGDGSVATLPLTLNGVPLQAGSTLRPDIAVTADGKTAVVTLNTSSSGGAAQVDIGSCTQPPCAGQFSPAFGLNGAGVAAVLIADGTSPKPKLAFTAQPQDAPVGATLKAVQVAVRDGTGATNTTATDSITLTLNPNPGGAQLGGTLTKPAVNGVATFADLSVDKPGQGYALVATDANPAVQSATSAPFTVSSLPTLAQAGSSSAAGNIPAVQNSLTAQNPGASDLVNVQIDAKVFPTFNVLHPAPSASNPAFASATGWDTGPTTADPAEGTITWTGLTVPQQGTLPIASTLVSPFPAVVANNGDTTSVLGWSALGWQDAAHTITPDVQRSKQGSDDRALVFSDSPEFLDNFTTTPPPPAPLPGSAVEGVLYRQPAGVYVNGKFRVYLNHENRAFDPQTLAPVPKNVYFVLYNDGASATEVFMQGHGVAVYTSDPVRAGKQALFDYLHTTYQMNAGSVAEIDLGSVPAHGARTFFVATIGGKRCIDAKTAMPCVDAASNERISADVVNAIFDLRTTGLLNVGVVAVNGTTTNGGQTDQFGAGGGANALTYKFNNSASRTYLAAGAVLSNPGETHIRGTFDHADRYVTITYDADSGKRLGWLMAQNPNKASPPANEYEPAIDTGAVNNGNFGVMYHVQVQVQNNADQNKDVQVMLDPRGVGADQTNHVVNGFSGIVQTHSPNTTPFPVPSTGNITDPDAAVGVGRIAGGSDPAKPFTLDFMPPAGDTLPVAIVLSPAYVRTTAIMTSSAGTAAARPTQLYESLSSAPAAGTTTAAPAGPGTNVLPVASNSSFVIGDTVQIDPGASNEEDLVITGFGSLVLNHPLTFAHAAGEPVRDLGRLPQDVTAPVTMALTPASTGAGWYNGPVDVSLIASDDSNGSGVAQTFYALDSAACSPSTLTLCSAADSTLTVSGDGHHTLTYFSVDRAGNVEAAHTLAVNIDTRPPATTLSQRASSCGTIVTLSATDATSGVAYVETNLDSGAWRRYGSPVTVPGGHTLHYRAVDVAGNVEAAHSFIATGTALSRCPSPFG